MFEIFGFILAISVPIFYVWGLVAFVRTVFGNKTDSGQQKVPPWSQNLMRSLVARMKEKPDITVLQFLQEIGVVESEADAAAETKVVAETVQAQPELSFEEAIAADETPAPRLASLMVQAKPTQSTQPAFSWSNWYRDNTINLLLYLGAFLIVAAVTLFVGFQWENFNSITRFTIVVVFTLAWYVAGFIANRFHGLELAGITFITIGAILTPFCGVAYQRFILDTMEGVGWTWFVTSLVSTVIYLGLSLFYHRRYFTYFGNLSILAMLLAVVQINEAPQEYFILAGCATALILLLVRIALRSMPRLDAYLGDDIEYSSLGILGVSVAFGLYLVPIFGIDFFSIQVLAVVVVTVIYLWVYSTLHLHTFTLLSAQLLTVAMMTHALITFEASTVIILYATLIAHLALQTVLNLWLKGRDEDIYRLSNSGSLLVTFVIYVASAVFLIDDWNPVVFALVLMLHSAYYASRFEMPLVYHLTATTWYLIAGHILLQFESGEVIGAIACFMAIGIVQVFAAYTGFDRQIRQAFVRVGLLAVGLMAMASIGYAGDEFRAQDAVTVQVMIALALTYIGLATYAYFAHTESRAENRLLEPIVHVITPFVGVLCYLISAGFEWHFVAASLALATGGLFIMAFRNNRHVLLVYLISASLYPATVHLVTGFNLPDEAYPIALALVSAVLFLLEVAVPMLPEDTHIHRKYAALIGVALTSLFSFGWAVENSSTSLHIAGWVSSYTFIALFWLGRSLFNQRAWDYGIGLVGLMQYYWHIYFLELTVNEALFSNPQWYFAAAGTLALILSFRERQRRTDETVINALEIGAALLFLLPTYGQSFNSGSLLYFLLGIVYSLLFVGLGVMFSRRLMQQIGAIALVIAVLIQTREFLLGLPRWLVVGIVGFAIMAAALYLSIRRRGEKREAV